MLDQPQHDSSEGLNLGAEVISAFIAEIEKMPRDDGYALLSERLSVGPLTRQADRVHWHAWIPSVEMDVVWKHDQFEGVQSCRECPTHHCVITVREDALGSLDAVIDCGGDLLDVMLSQGRALCRCGTVMIEDPKRPWRYTCPHRHLFNIFAHDVVSHRGGWASN